MKNDFNNFRVFADSASAAETEKALKDGKHLLIVSSPSEYFDGSAARNAIELMKKYPDGKVFVTSPVSSSILEQVCKKAESGAGLLETYVYAEALAKAQAAV